MESALTHFESTQAEQEDHVVAAIFDTFTYPSFSDAKRCLNHEKLQREYLAYTEERHLDLKGLFASRNDVATIKALGTKYNDKAAGGANGLATMQELFYSYSNTIGWVVMRAQELQHGDRELGDGEIDTEWEHDPRITSVARNEIFRQVQKNWDGIGNWMY